MRREIYFYADRRQGPSEGHTQLALQLPLAWRFFAFRTIHHENRQLVCTQHIYHELWIGALNRREMSKLVLFEPFGSKQSKYITIASRYVLERYCYRRTIPTPKRECRVNFEYWEWVSLVPLWSPTKIKSCFFIDWVAGVGVIVVLQASITHLFYDV